MHCCWQLHKTNVVHAILSVEPVMSAVNQHLLSRRTDTIELLSKIVSFSLHFNFYKILHIVCTWLCCTSFTYTHTGLTEQPCFRWRYSCLVDFPSFHVPCSSCPDSLILIFCNSVLPRDAVRGFPSVWFLQLHHCTLCLLQSLSSLCYMCSECLSLPFVPTWLVPVLTILAQHFLSFCHCTPRIHLIVLIVVPVWWRQILTEHFLLSFWSLLLLPSMWHPLSASNIAPE